MKVSVVVLTLLFVSTIVAENVKALVILPKYFGLNTHLIREMMDSYGWEVTLTAVDSTVQPCNYSSSQGSNSYPVDIKISDITDVTVYDCVVVASSSWLVVGSTAYMDLKNSPECLELIHNANEAGLVVSATCAGMRVLAAADVINGKHVTGKAGNGNIFLNEVLAAGGIYDGQNILPVVDGNIVTSTRGQFYNEQIFNALVNALENSRNLRKGK
ncbi:MAG: DJ-1/PfpI family protein [Candidatus Delongbacteria bacterium]|nr:DJ-1/PfpI family protein [Candidatus Delongbacteria bacterium]MBN2835954.1 DJ-1/PfpI family protein [Candidatus Delongbacteria bacterium]